MTDQTQIVKKEFSVQEARDLFTANELRKKAAQGAAQLLKAQAKEQGLSQALDEKIKKFIVMAKATKNDFNEKRSIFTKKLDAIKKGFTSQESELQKEIDELQGYRNTFVKQVEEAKEKERRAAEIQARKSEELIELKAQIEMEVRKGTQALIDDYKRRMKLGLDSLTKDNFIKKEEGLKAINTAMDPSNYDKLEIKVISRFGNDTEPLITEAKAMLRDEMLKHYQTEIHEYKVSSLSFMKQFNQMTNNEIEAAKKAAEDQIALDSAEAIDVAQADVDNKKDAEQAMSSFDNIVQVETQTPEARKTFKIVVEHKSAYPALVAYWFSICFAEFDKNILTKTVKSMIGDLERHANKTGQQLNVDKINYETSYSAINRK